MDSLVDTMRRILAFRDERDWSRFHTPGNLASAIAVEVAELQEALLWKSDPEISEFLADPEGKTEVTREIADVLIFSLLFCHATGVDPVEAIKSKLEENSRKYPVELCKGKAWKYTKLDKRSERS